MTTNQTDEQRRVLTALLRCVQAMAEINSQQPIGELANFIAVALDPGHGPQKYGQTLGQPESTVSRWMIDLSNEERGATDAKLLQWRPNPENLRRKMYSLTPKGQAMINRFFSAWERLKP